MKDKGRGRGSIAHCIHLNGSILNCSSAGELCELIETHAVEFNHINVQRTILSYAGKVSKA